jgi:hypothetical protein
VNRKVTARMVFMDVLSTLTMVVKTFLPSDNVIKVLLGGGCPTKSIQFLFQRFLIKRKRLGVSSYNNIGGFHLREV